MRHFLIILTILLGITVVKPSPARAVLTMSYEDVSPGDDHSSRSPTMSEQGHLPPIVNAGRGFAVLLQAEVANQVQEFPNLWAMEQSWLEFDVRVIYWLEFITRDPH